MLSDVNYATLPFEMSTLPEASTTHLEEDPLVPLNFDDLLDIAREFEFTSTITHIWPCEEEFSTLSGTELEGMFTASVPTLNTEASPLPSPSLGMPTTIHIQEVDLHRPASMCPASADISTDPAHLSKDDDQVLVKVEPPITSMLRGWFPPNGSQFLDLDDSLMLPQTPRDTWTPATFLAPPCIQPAINTSQPPAMFSVVGDVRPQMAVTEPNVPPVSTADKTTNEPIKSATLPLARLPTGAIVELVRARAVLQTDSNAPGRTTTTFQTNASKSRPYLPSIPAAGGASAARYAKAPRGGIPPHIARTVTKANTLLVERARQVMRDAFPSTAMGEGKKPSVLRRAAKAERETSKTAIGGDTVSVCDENDQESGRATKRARV